MGPPSCMRSIDWNVVMRRMTVDKNECLVLSPVHLTAQERSPSIHFTGSWVCARTSLDAVPKWKITTSCRNQTSILWSFSPYTGCPRRNVKYFGRVFLELNYTDITQNTYIQSWTVTEITAREVWNFDICYTLTDYQIHIETGRNMWFL